MDLFSAVVLYDQVGVGLYGHDTLAGPVTDFAALVPPAGLELSHRNTGLLTEEAGRNDHLRLYRDATGALVVDQLAIDGPMLSVRVRPELGDHLDLAVLGGVWESTWRSYDGDRAQARLYTPSNLTLLGFSNTDEDLDDALKHYVSIGAGLGGELSVEVLGPVGLVVRGEGFARTRNRHRAGLDNTVRHEVDAEVEAGLGLLTLDPSVIVTAWAELNSQWETRDDDGASGLDRQHAAAGARVSVRFQGVGDLMGDRVEL